MNSANDPKIAAIIQEIRSQVPELQSLSDELRAKWSAIPGDDGVLLGTDFWRPVIVCDAIVRIRLFSEQNFIVIETLGLLAMARYVFELVVWLKHIERDPSFSLAYARFLTKQQLEFYETLATHLAHEADMYERLGAEEAKLHKDLLSDSIDTNRADAGALIAQAMKSASQAVDSQLTANFAIYSDRVEALGYSYVTHLVRSKAIPDARKNAESCRETLERLNRRWGSTIDSLKVGKWRWEERAKFVGMENEYAFIYSYTSRMLHAHPHSLSTDQKNLEEPEILLFLRYIEMQFRWIRKLAGSHLGRTSLH